MKGKRAFNWKKKEKKISKKNGKKRKDREGGRGGGRREGGKEGKYRWKSGQARLAFCGFVL